MAEMSAGAKAAWERWTQETNTPDFGMIRVPDLEQRAFAAGFAAALAALEAYRVHVEEFEGQYWKSGQDERARVYCRAGNEAENIRMWITQNFTCRVAEHVRCREEAKTR